MAGFYYGWQMALLILGIMPFLIVAAWVQTKFTAGAHNQVSSHAARLSHAGLCQTQITFAVWRNPLFTSFVHLACSYITTHAETGNLQRLWHDDVVRAVTCRHSRSLQAPM